MTSGGTVIGVITIGIGDGIAGQIEAGMTEGPETEAGLGAPAVQTRPAMMVIQSPPSNGSSVAGHPGRRMASKKNVKLC